MGGASIESELTWLLAGTARRRAAADRRIRDLAREASFDAVAAEMDRHRSRTILGARARALGITPVSFDAQLTEVERVAAARGALFSSLTVRALTRLEERGIPTLPLKGVVLSEIAHRDPGARSSNDIDLLVARTDLSAAEGVLAELGYRRYAEEPSSAIHLTFRAPEPWKPNVELHWRVHWYGDAFVAEMLRRSRVGPDGVRQASPTTTLASLLLFYARDGFAGLRLAIDIAAYADTIDGERTGDELLALVDLDPEIRPALLTAIAVAEATVGLDLALTAPPRSGRQVRAVRLANWRLEGEPDQIRATMRLIDVLLTPAGRGGDFAASRLTPYHTRRENLVYAIKMALRWLPALVSIAGGRVAHPLPGAAPDR